MSKPVELPDMMGWWARGRGGRQVEWFHVQTFDDGTPPSIWVSAIEDFIPVTKFTSPLTRWWGPVDVPFDDPEAERFQITGDMLLVTLKNGRIIRSPIARHERLKNATYGQRINGKLIAEGRGPARSRRAASDGAPTRNDRGRAAVPRVQR